MASAKAATAVRRSLLVGLVWGMCVFITLLNTTMTEIVSRFLKIVSPGEVRAVKVSEEALERNLPSRSQDTAVPPMRLARQ
jgi:hypothetical protein